MALYHVVWEIHLDAEDSLEAAKEAEKIMLDPKLNAKIFLAKENGKAFQLQPKGYIHIDLKERI